MRWYNPKIRNVEVTSAPTTDEEASEHLRGHLSSSMINNPAGYPAQTCPALLLPYCCHMPQQSSLRAAISLHIALEVEG